MQHDSEPSRCRRKWLWEKYTADGPWSKSFLRTRLPPPSLAAVIFKLLLKLATYDIAIYTIQRAHPSLDTPAGDITTARRACGVLHTLRRHRRVHDRRHDVPYRDPRRLRAPAAARRGLARALRAPLDGYLDRRVPELPLAPVLPTHLRRLLRPDVRISGRRGRCSTRLGCPPCCTTLACRGSGNGIRFELKARIHSLIQ